MTHKLKWTVGEAPTGRYRSFQKRAWPIGSLDGETAVFISCEDSYTPRLARGEAEHAPLRVSVTDRREAYKDGKGAWVVRRLKQEFKTLDEAKAAAQDFVDKFPEFFVVLPRP